MGSENSQLSLNISVHSAHFPCRNERTSIYEVRRKSLYFRGLPPNSLIFKARCLFLNGGLGGGEACDRHTEWRAAGVVHAYTGAELH